MRGSRLIEQMSGFLVPMKKTTIAIFCCWVFFAGSARGSTIQSWHSPQEVLEEDSLEFLIGESSLTLGQGSREPDLSTFQHDRHKDGEFKPELVKDFIEVFSRLETEHTIGPLPATVEKKDPKEKPATHINGLFSEISRPEVQFEQPSLQWVIFVAGICLLAGTLMFRLIPKGPAVFMIVVWILFWELIVTSVIATISLFDAILQRM